MKRLRDAMALKFKEKDEDVKIHCPRNLETLELSFRGERVAKVWRYLIPIQKSTATNYIHLGYWNPSRQASPSQRCPFWTIGSQGLLLYTPRPPRSSGLHWPINMYRHTATETRNRCRLGFGAMAFGGDVRESRRRSRQGRSEYDAGMCSVASYKRGY